MHHDHRFTLPKIANKITLLKSAIFRDSRTLAPPEYQPLADARPFDQLLIGNTWEALEYNAHWSGNRRDFLLKMTYQIPESWSLVAPIALSLPLGDNPDSFQAHPEALIYVDGEPFTTVDARHQLLFLPDALKDHAEHTLILHGWTGLGGALWGDDRPSLYLRPCQLVITDEDLRAFITLAQATHEAASILNDDAPAKVILLNALDNAFKMLDTREPLGDALRDGVGRALGFLQNALKVAGDPLDVTIYASGHAHIDTAWLWTLAQTRNKAIRSFHTVSYLMSRYPDYRYVQSQPQLYEYIRRDAPELFERIKAHVAAGQWELLGGMWVEADCNMSGAESLMRQFILGRRFFEEHFGTDTDSPVLWLPDAFGFPYSLPQIARHAGIEYFFTTKMRWSEHNQIPYDSFWWRGIDGSCLLAHFSSTPEYNRPHVPTYNAIASAENVLMTWREMRMKDVQRIGLMSYGYGDGGGGPNMDMIEALSVMADFPAMPRARMSRVIDFFDDLRHADHLPVWDGELYLETHQGTLTSQAGVKRDMRRAESTLHALEFAAIWACLLDPAHDYPAESLVEMWRTVCLNQFHDILPGSSIAEVYTESAGQFNALQTTANIHLSDALDVLVRHAGGDLLIVNPSSCARNDVLLWDGHLDDGEALFTPSGEVVPTQTTESGTLIQAELPMYSLTPLIRRRAQVAPRPALIAASDLLENDHLRVSFDVNGDIVSIYDKTRHRQVLPDYACANQFQLFEDRPRFYDAWNIDPSFDDRLWTTESADIRVAEVGALRATLEIRRAFMNSTAVQRVHIYRDSRRIDFETRIDWREKQMLLKVAFPTNIHNNQATYDIQWGHMQRPTHQNTSWDQARYEVPAHHWADLSEDDFGVSLLNDCKYGYDVRDGVLRLTLLKSATYPDAHADTGEHAFTYSLLLHDGDLGAVIAAGYALNHAPLIVAGTGQTDPTPASLVLAAPDNVIVETIKREEDGEGLVVRLYESRRRRARFTLTFDFEIGSAWRTDALERERAAVHIDGNTAQCNIRPFEIITMVVYPR